MKGAKSPKLDFDGTRFRVSEATAFCGGRPGTPVRSGDRTLAPYQTEPLLERLWSSKISQPLWLARFSRQGDFTIHK
jgi:hypothetical protein